MDEQIDAGVSKKQSIEELLKQSVEQILKQKEEFEKVQAFSETNVFKTILEKKDVPNLQMSQESVPKMHGLVASALQIFKHEAEVDILKKSLNSPVDNLGSNSVDKIKQFNEAAVRFQINLESHKETAQTFHEIYNLLKGLKEEMKKSKDKEGNEKTCGTSSSLVSCSETSTSSEDDVSILNENCVVATSSPIRPLSN